MPQIGGFVSLKTFMFLLFLVLCVCTAVVAWIVPSWLKSVAETLWNIASPGMIGATL